MVFDPAAQNVEAPQPHKDVALYDPILRAQTIEARHKARAATELLRQPTPHQHLMPPCSEGAQEGSECVVTMEVDKTNYGQMDTFIPDHPAVTNYFLESRRDNELRAVFNNVKQAKSFCREHFNGLNFQAVYHPWEHHCATATWGGRAKDAHVYN
jgi:hypothetical protein